MKKTNGKNLGELGFEFPQRQIHLDYHTSPFITDASCEFDAKAFAKTMKEAHVNSVTVFAKCHHGQSYYKTKVGVMHPALKGRDMLGEMIEALHSQGIRAPIYTTISWEEDVAAKHPEWRQMRFNGTFAQVEGASDFVTKQPGGWKFNSWVHPEYQDYIEAHLRELLENYDCDGFFLDILFLDGQSDWNEPSIRLREKHGLLGTDVETFKRFESIAQDQFCSRFTKVIKGLAPKATIFYNSNNDIMTDVSVGGRVRDAYQTHFEIESLPSGFWGYYHFPRLARSAGRWGKQWIGMTGRFQKMWGDFGGIKPQPALEYECFRSQALGGGNSVGDQLPPRGTLDAAAYKLIGAVYKQTADAEPFYQDSKELPQVGVITANHPLRDINITCKSDEAAIQMCEEAHYDCELVDEVSDIAGYDALILPDTTVITDKLLAKLRKYYADGGKLILSYEAGRDAKGNWALDFLPLEFKGQVQKFPTYWRARKDFWPELSASDRVFYTQGLNVAGGKGTKALVDRVLPYFRRTDLTFCSHFQTPPVAAPDKFPAVIAGKNFVYFADPVFREYRQVGNIAVRDVWKRAIEGMIGEAPFGAGLPTTVQVYPRRRGKDLLLTLLHYVPLRKALDLDVLEERMSFAGEVLQLPADAKEVIVYGTGEKLKRVDGGFQLPFAKGRLLLEVPGFFKK